MNHIRCYAIVLPGRKSGFGPDFGRILFGEPQRWPPGRPKAGRVADFEVFQMRIRSRCRISCPEALLREIECFLALGLCHGRPFGERRTETTEGGPDGVQLHLGRHQLEPSPHPPIPPTLPHPLSRRLGEGGRGRGKGRVGGLKFNSQPKGSHGNENT